MNHPDLTSRRTLVVGHDEGVARVIAEALSGAGATVFGLPLDKLDDATDGDEMVRTGIRVLGGLDVLVSCLGGALAVPLVDLTDEDLDRTVQQNLTTPIRLLRAAGRHMVEQKRGRIIQAVSLVGERGVPNTAVYGACQAGLIQSVKALALEWARTGVRINAIGLGWMEGDPLASGPGSDRLTRYLPTKRLGRPDEAGPVAVYLASDAADMMTGQTLWVDGAILSHA